MKRLLGPLAVVAVAVSLVTACGGGGSPTGPTAPSPIPTKTPAPTPTPTGLAHVHGLVVVPGWSGSLESVIDVDDSGTFPYQGGSLTDRNGFYDLLYHTPGQMHIHAYYPLSSNNYFFPPVPLKPYDKDIFTIPGDNRLDIYMELGPTPTPTPR